MSHIGVNIFEVDNLYSMKRAKRAIVRPMIDRNCRENMVIRQENSPRVSVASFNFSDAVTSSGVRLPGLIG